VGSQLHHVSGTDGWPKMKEDSSRACDRKILSTFDKAFCSAID
jgi:hypothetical protein